MQQLGIPEYSTASIHVYNIERTEPITEEYIESLGYII